MLKVSEEHIEKIFHNIVSCRNFVIQAAFINTLRTMAKVGIFHIAQDLLLVIIINVG